MMLIFEVNFDNLRRKKELVWFRLFATTFSPLGLTLFNLISKVCKVIGKYCNVFGRYKYVY
jgi:hypothetical protein